MFPNDNEQGPAAGALTEEKALAENGIKRTSEKERPPFYACVSDFFCVCVAHNDH